VSLVVLVCGPPGSYWDESIMLKPSHEKIQPWFWGDESIIRLVQPTMSVRTKCWRTSDWHTNFIIIYLFGWVSCFHMVSFSVL
jgi:hypothetical protein